MYVANHELCKELYQLSGWSDTEGRWSEGQGEASVSQDAWGFGDTPAYDLGYLLRKLPAYYSPHSSLSVRKTLRKGFVATYYRVVSFQSASPEDAAAELAIHLFKHGVIAR